MINFTGMTTKQKIVAVGGFMTAALAISSIAIASLAPDGPDLSNIDTTDPAYTGYRPPVPYVRLLAIGFVVWIVPAILLCVGAYFHARYQKGWGLLLLEVMTGYKILAFFLMWFSVTNLSRLGSQLITVELFLTMLTLIFGLLSRDYA